MSGDTKELVGRAPLVVALLSPPGRPPAMISRPRLIDLITTAASSPITIVSGEAAAGKTSLVVDWINSLRADRPVCWTTVHRELDDAVLFWRYVVAAVEQLGVDASDLKLALADGEPPSEQWLTALANRLAGIPGEPVLVVDDLHELESADALASLLAFLERTPPAFHVVLITRSKPPWHLARWRVSGRLAEVDSQDLRFTSGEVRELVEAAEFELSDDDMAKLVERTEGWAGGIRLALLSIRHSGNPSAFVARFAADDELVSSYLFREVLDRQAPETRAFLLDISILDQITPAICDALRERDDSRKFLDECRNESLFVTDAGSADNYHLHTLFSQLLRTTLEFDDPEAVPALHQRASALYEDQGDVRAAIRHAVAARDHARTGELVARHSSRFAQRGEVDEIRSWLSLLRRNEHFSSPEIELGLAITLGLGGRPAEALEHLDHLEASEQSARIRYAALQVRAITMVVEGDFDALAELASAFETHVPPGDLAMPFEPVGAASYFAGLAAYFNQNPLSARRSFERAAEPRVDPDLLYVESPGWLARIAHAEGDLVETERQARESLARNAELGGADTAVVTPAYLALADAAWERDQLDEADARLAKARRSIWPLPWQAVFVEASASRVSASRGEPAEALAQLIECGQTYLRPDSAPQLHALMSERLVDVALRAGDADEAHRWASAHAQHGAGPLPASLELRLAEPTGTEEAAVRIDEALAASSTVPGQIDTLLAGASQLARLGAQHRCVDLVARATRLAEPGGQVRRFQDADHEVHEVVRGLVAGAPAASDASVASRFFLEFLAATLSAQPDPTPRPRGRCDDLVEQLSDRELQVLDQLVVGHTYAEMASALYVSRNTVKSHVSHIYTKLGVSGRSAAVDRARQLGLI